jgi:hypothetical protein
MMALLGIVRGTVGFAVGMVAGMVLLALGRQLAFGDGFGPTPVGLALPAQVAVTGAWFVAAGVAVWVALRLSRRRLAGLVAGAWLFQMVWLSPEVRPVVLEMRAVIAASVAIAGFGAYFVWRVREERSGRSSQVRQTA